MKKTRNLFILMSLVIALLLTGCANDNPNATTESTAPDQTKQTDATVDLTELVVFPDAPEKAAVKALPQTYDAKTLVTPYWEEQFKFSTLKNTEFYMSIPQIYPFSEDAVACQQEIYELFKSDAEWPLLLLEDNGGKAELLDKREDIFFDQDQYRMCYSYQAGCYNDVLSIAIRINGMDVTWSNYYVFYLDLTTGKRLTEEEANAKYAVDKANIKSVVEAYYRQKNENVDEKLDYYQDNLKKTVADENIDACRLFCTEEGKLMVVADIYAAGSVEKVENLIEIPV